MGRQRFLEVETVATATELEQLTDGSDATSLHLHREDLWVDMPAPINGWVPHANPEFTPQYMISPDGFIRLRGVVDGTLHTGTVIYDPVPAPINPTIPFGVSLRFIAASVITSTYFRSLISINIFNISYAKVDDFVPQSVYLDGIRYMPR